MPSYQAQPLRRKRGRPTTAALAAAMRGKPKYLNRPDAHLLKKKRRRRLYGAFGVRY